MTDEEFIELNTLGTAERAGRLLTGVERGRLADLRRKEILLAVAAMIADAQQPKLPIRETR